MDWLKQASRSPSWIAVAVAAVVIGACGSEPTGLDGDCPGDGGVLFSLEGSLESAEPPYSVVDAVDGCIRIASDAAAPGSESTDRSDVTGFRVTVGDETWAGDGFSLAGQAPAGLRGGGIRFSVSTSGAELTVHFAEGGQPSSPSGHHLLFADSGTATTRFQIKSAVDPFPELGTGTVAFSR